VPEHTNKNNINLMPFDEIFLVVTLLINKKRKVPEEKGRKIQSMLTRFSHTGKIIYSATVLK
jgi:hypothetical protein